MKNARSHPRVTGSLLAAAALLAAGCSAARRTPPIAPALPFESDPRLARGHAAYQAHCHACHPHGEAGLGPALNNKPLPGFLIRFQVRHGLGVMPEFDPDRLSADELDAIVHYLLTLRGNEPGPTAGRDA